LQRSPCTLLKKWFNGDAKEQFKMDFKKCSEVYGYKSIAEVEEEESNNRVCDFAQALIDAGKITADEAAHFSNLSRDRFKDKI
jgi:hypothetical protein